MTIRQNARPERRQSWSQALWLGLAICVLPRAAHAQIVNQPVSVPTGVQQFNASIANGPSFVTVRLKRATTLTPLFWPLAATTVKVRMWASTDGGATYREGCGFGQAGGIYTKRDGTEATESTARCQLPPGIGRLLRVQVTVANGPLVSEITAEAE